MRLAPSRADEVHAVLVNYVSPMTAQSMMRAALDRAGVSEAKLSKMGLDPATFDELRRGIEIFVAESRRAECLGRLDGLVSGPRTGPSGDTRLRAAQAPVMEISITNEDGIVDARTRAKALAAEIGFRATEQYKIATVVSELSRNIYRYAGSGRVRVGPTSPRAGIFVIAKDEGPGIADVELVLSPTYRSRTGLGRGLQGCKKIVDEFELETKVGRGTTIVVRKYL